MVSSLLSFFILLRSVVDRLLLPQQSQPTTPGEQDVSHVWRPQVSEVRLGGRHRAGIDDTCDTRTTCTSYFLLQSIKAVVQSVCVCNA